VLTLQRINAQLTGEVQEKDEALAEQRAIKEQLAATLREQAARIRDLEARLGASAAER